MKKKIVDFVRDNKGAVGAGLSAMATSVMSLPAFATETDTVAVSETLQESVSTSLNAVVTDFLGYVAIVVPIGLAIFGATFGIKKGLAFFKSLASK